MARSPARDAVIHLDARGRYTGANRRALELLGVTLAELRASPPDRFAISTADKGDQAALREAWEAGGSQPVVGTVGLKRADGRTVRVSYAIEAAPSGFTAPLREVEGSPEAPPSLFTVGRVLHEWRAAERSLAELVPGSAEWQLLLAEIEMLREKYQELFAAHAPGLPRRAPPGH